MLGQPIWDYTHQCDHTELKNAFNIKYDADNGPDTKTENAIFIDHRDLFVRLKCTLTSRGRNINIKSAAYKVSKM